MCDLKAYVKKTDREELLLEAVNFVQVENGIVVLRNLFHEERSLPGSVTEVSLIKNRLVIEPH